MHYDMLGLDEIWIDGQGREADAREHDVLDDLKFGEAVHLEQRGARFALVAQGAVIGWLTERAALAWRGRGATLKFVAAIRRTADQSDPTWRARLRRDAWWVPACEGTWRG